MNVTDRWFVESPFNFLFFFFFFLTPFECCLWVVKYISRMFETFHLVCLVTVLVKQVRFCEPINLLLSKFCSSAASWCFGVKSISCLPILIITRLPVWSFQWAQSLSVCWEKNITNNTFLRSWHLHLMAVEVYFSPESNFRVKFLDYQWHHYPLMIWILESFYYSQTTFSVASY